MLFGFFSGLIIFFILFVVVLIVFIKTIKLRQTNTLPVIMLGVLMVFTLVVTSIYSIDFYFLKSDQTNSTAGACTLEFVRGNGNSADSTEVKIDNKTYSIRSSRYKDMEDGHYYCDLTYLPITKIVKEISIHK